MSDDKFDLWCFQCFAKSGKEGPLLRCGGCNKALYCSKNCHLTHWNGGGGRGHGKHQMLCKAMAPQIAGESGVFG
jgi:hypothetical protein